MRFKGKKKWVLLLVVIVVGFVAIRILSGGKQDVKAVQAVTAVKTAEVGQMMKQGEFEYAGSLEAGAEAIINAKNGGKVASIFVEDGARVAKGQKLVQLDSLELKNTVAINSANLKKSEIAMGTAKTNFDRYKQLYEAGGMSKKEFDDAQTLLQVAQADMDVARAAVSNAQDGLSNATVTSPISGIVSGKNVKLGQMLSPGQQIMSVQSTGNVYCVVNVQQAEAGVVKKGALADVTVESFPNKVFKGKVESMDAAANVEARTFKTKILINNKDAALKPGMYAKATVFTGSDVKVIAVPMVSVTGEEGLYSVFVNEGGKAKRVPIVLGDVMDKYVEVKSGLKVGEKIVVTNVSSLKEGDRLALKQQ